MHKREKRDRERVRYSFFNNMCSFHFKWLKIYIYIEREIEIEQDILSLIICVHSILNDQKFTFTHDLIKKLVLSH